MSVSAEVILIAAVVCLYLYDSALLIYCNEGVLSPKGKDDWAVTFGSRTVGLLGKELLLPHPLLFHRPMFRLSWRFEGADPVGDWIPSRNDFRPIGLALWCMAIALFVFLPLGLLTRFGDQMLICAIAVFYLSMTFVLLWLWLRKEHLNLSRRRFAALTFESLICPPFALNLVRHVSLQRSVNEDLLSVSWRLQKPASWVQSRAEFLARLDDQIEFEEPGSDRMMRLQAQRQALIQGSETWPQQKLS